MTDKFFRRRALNLIAATVVGAASRSTATAATAAPPDATDPWNLTRDPVCHGGDFSANPMKDFQRQNHPL